MTKKLLPVLALLATPFVYGAPTFTGETTNPFNSCFAIGTEAKALFAAKDFAPGSEQELVVRFFDGEENEFTDWAVTRTVKIGADGTWKGEVALPMPKFGFYRLRATLGGVELPAVGSRPKGCLTYLVSMDPKDRRLWTEDDHFLGIHGDVSGEAELKPWMGARWQLRGLGPYGSEEEYRKAKDAYDKHGWISFGFYSPQVSHFRWGSGSWPKADQEWLKKHLNDQWAYFTDPEGREVYRRIIEQKVRLSLQQPFSTKTRMWETMWEPELSAKPEVLLDAVRYSTKLIKDIDPEAKIAIPTVSGMKKLDYYEQIFKLGILDYADVFDMHFYAEGMPPEESGYLKKLRAIIKMVHEYSGRNLPMIATEGGYNTKATKEEEFKQMTGVTRTLLMLLGEGFKFGLPFYGTDYGGDYADRAEGDWGMTYNLELPKVRFGARHVSPRPVLAAMSGFGMMVDGSRPTACLDYLGETALGYAFENPDGEVTIALWCWGEKPTVVELPVGVAKVRVGDIFGNVTEQVAAGGVFKATLSPKPIYVKDVAPALWGKQAVKAVKADRSTYPAVAGGTVTIRGTADRAGELEVRPSPVIGLKPFVLPVTAGAFAFDLKLPALLANGDYPVMLSFRENGTLVSLAGATLAVDAPVKTRAITASFASGAPAVSVTLENLTDEVRSGTVETRVIGEPDARVDEAVTLQPHETRTVTLVAKNWAPSPFKAFDARVAFVEANGYRSELVKRVNFLSAAYAQGVGKDGRFADWRCTWLELPRDIRRKPEFTKDEKDLSAKMALGWNEDYFLMAFEVEDDDFCGPGGKGWWCWRGDAVQVAFAKDVLLKLSENVWADALDQALTENALALTPDGVSFARTVSYDPTTFPCDINGTRALITDAPCTVTATPKAAGGYTISYRLAFPWKYMNKDTAKAGETIYFSAAVNDLDRDQADLSAISVFEMKKLAPRGFGAVYLDK